jgi:hypothetical protein
MNMLMFFKDSVCSIDLTTKKDDYVVCKRVSVPGAEPAGLLVGMGFSGIPELFYYT